MQKRRVIAGFSLVLAATVAGLRIVPGLRGAAVANAPATGTTPSDPLAAGFNTTVRPFVETYCVSCHSGEKAKADLDLSSFTSLADVTNDLPHWSLILTRLKAQEMPPKEAPKHPTADQVKPVMAWITELNTEEIKLHAGDPGPVLARRLSNAEYDYTIHDLTGVDLRPTKEFPVDPDNQAGFDNSGESLAMTPALLKKYFQAATAVADTLVLEPDGFTFAPHPMLDDNDRDKYSVLRIVDFYLHQPTDYAEYFLAAWRYQHRAELGEPQATLTDIATESKVSAKYLTTVWTALNDPNEKVGPIAKMQAAWRAWPAPAESDPATIRAHANQLRDWVLNLRDQIVPTVPNLSGGGFSGGSQPAVLWKDRQMAANRRTYDPSMMRLGTPTTVANLPPLASETAVAAAPPPAGDALAALDKAPTTGILATPKPGERLASGLGTPAAPVAQTAADGRPLSALEISQLAEAAQPVRRQGGGGPLPKTPDIVKYGGVFLVAPVVTSASSVTAMMARAKLRGNTQDPDLIVPEDPAEWPPYQAAFARFASIFPDAFFISERARVFNDATTEESLDGRLLSAGLQAQVGYFRDDGPLCDLILDDAGKRELDKLWEVFYFNAEVAPRMHLAFLSVEGGSLHGAGFEEFRPENHDAAKPEMIQKLADLTMARLGNLQGPALQAAQDFFTKSIADNQWLEKAKLAAEPSHLKALQDFAERAWRRPLTQAERDGLVAFYHESRDANGLDHEDAMRDCIVRVLMSPNFCYRIDLVEAAGSGAPTAAKGGASRTKVALTSDQQASTDAPAASALKVEPLSDYALASRLSYFLWASMPDAELLEHAKAGDLHRPEVLAAQAQRMLKDDRVNNFATEFAGNWLDFRRFEEHNAVDRERFPVFTNDLREAMFQEPIHFFVNLIQQGRPVFDLVYGNYTLVNPLLASYYGMTVPANTAADKWVEIDDAEKYQRGGLLPMSVFLTKNAPGLRTSPVKRGYWVVTRLLGERIPPPPPNVPVIPTDETKLGDLTLAETMARHHADPNCAGCHEKFDAFGLVFEGYGPVGEIRTKDLADRPVQTTATFPDGSEENGLEGLRAYIHTKVQDEFVDNLCRKLLAYGLGRTLISSDDPLIEAMKAKLAANGNRFDALVDAIVTSPQFLNKRASAPVALKTASNN